jgi:nucleotide-binding universal stress UspA family protein
LDGKHRQPFGKHRIQGFIGMTFKTILVAVDGSTHATKTVEVAADVAEHYGAKLLILNVVAPIFAGSQRDALNNLARIEHMERTEYEMLQELGGAIVQSAETNARQKGIANVEALVEVGDPASVIVDMVRARSVDLVVLGRRGLGTMTGLLLGSVSHKVIQLAHTPCLTVS